LDEKVYYIEIAEKAIDIIVGLIKVRWYYLYKATMKSQYLSSTCNSVKNTVDRRQT